MMGVPGSGVGNNDVFDPNPIPDLVRILRAVDKRLDSVEDPRELDHGVTIFDVNDNGIGNGVGRFKPG